MSLKQECIDMIRLILEPLMKNENDIYNVDTDEYIDICLDTGEDQYEMFCAECPNYNRDVKCKNKICEKVDIALFSTAHPEGESKYFVFNRKPKHPKLREKINYIHNRNQLIEVMTAYKKEAEYFRDGYAEYGSRLEEYKQHADDFCKQIIKDFSVFNIVNPDMIPVVFYDSYRKDHDYNSRKAIGGDFAIRRKQSIIRIYSSWDNDMKEVKQRIRHEIIHYLLWCVGLDYGDESAVFHYLCNLYDARAYQKLKDNYNVTLLKILELSEKEKNNTLFINNSDAADKITVLTNAG